MSFLAPADTGLVLAQSAVAVPLTGPTTETVMASVTIPGGSMGSAGALRVRSLWSLPSNANSKTPRIRLGGAAGTIFLSTALTTSLSFWNETYIANRGSASAQISNPLSGAFGLSGSALVTGSIDTSVDQALVFSGLLGVGTDTLTLEAYLIELIRI